MASYLSIRELEKVRTFEINGEQITAPKAHRLAHYLGVGEQIEVVNCGLVTLDNTRNQHLIPPLLQYRDRTDQQILETLFKDGRGYSSAIAIVGQPNIALSSIVKTAAFGSSGGRSTGSHQTRIAEIAHAMAMSLVGILGRPITEADLTPANLTIASRFVVPVRPTDIDSVVTTFDERPTWKKSCVNTANVLFHSHVNLTNKMFYHESSDLVKQICGLVMKANAVHPDRPFTHHSKWNPGDIWIADPDFALTADYQTVEQWNDQMRRWFDSQTIVAVSLKQATSNAETTIHNYDPMTEWFPVSVTRFDVARKNNCEKLFANSYSRIFYNEGTVGHNMEIRAARTGTQVNGEVQADNSCAGKIGFGAIYDALWKTVRCRLDKWQVWDQQMKTNGIDHVSRLVGEMACQVVDCSFTPALEQILLDQGRQKPTHDLIAKAQSVQLIHILSQHQKRHPHEVDAFVNTAHRYATSTTDLSSVFVKVS